VVTETVRRMINTLIIDLVGLWTDFSGLDDVDGNNIVTGSFAVRYDATAASAGQIIVVNETAAL
jgi:hypothetical protein